VLIPHEAHVRLLTAALADAVVPENTTTLTWWPGDRRPKKRRSSTSLHLRS